MDQTGILAEGLTYDITTRIARTRSVTVTARGTAFKFAKHNQDVRAIGARLNVRYVCYGAVQVEGTRVRSHAGLAEAESREEVWADTYDQQLEGFIRTQERIAAQIVSAIHAEIDRREQMRSLLVPSESLDAWSAFHRGCWYMYKFQKEHVESADRMFRRSIELEPTVPRPYAGLSFIHFQRAFLGLTHDRFADIRQSGDLALRALELDPEDPMAHWAYSRYHLIKGNLESAQTSLRTAIEQNPSYAIALYTLGWVEMHLGHNQAAIEQINVARRLSPMDPLMFAMMGVQALSMALIGRTREAADLAQESIRQPNAHVQAYAFATVSLALDDRWREARQVMRRVWANDPTYDSRSFLQNFPFQRQGDVHAIESVFRQMHDDAQPSSHVPRQRPGRN